MIAHLRLQFMVVASTIKNRWHYKVHQNEKYFDDVYAPEYVNLLNMFIHGLLKNKHVALSGSPVKAPHFAWQVKNNCFLLYVRQPRGPSISLKPLDTNNSFAAKLVI